MQSPPKHGQRFSKQSVIEFVLLLTAGDDEETGIRRSELVNWYLKEMEHEIDSEAELMEKKMLVEKVLHKLVNVVRISPKAVSPC